MCWASEWPDVKNYKWRLNPVWHRMIYSCTHMATLGVKGYLISNRHAYTLHFCTRRFSALYNMDFKRTRQLLRGLLYATAERSLSLSLSVLLLSWHQVGRIQPVWHIPGKLCGNAFLNAGLFFYIELWKFIGIDVINDHAKIKKRLKWKRGKI